MVTDMNDEHESAREKSAQIKFMKWVMENPEEYELVTKMSAQIKFMKWVMKNPEEYELVTKMILERYKKVFEELAKV